MGIYNSARDATRRYLVIGRMRCSFEAVSIGAVALIALVGGIAATGFVYWKLNGEIEALRNVTVPAAQRIVEERNGDTVVIQEYIPQTTQEEKIIMAVRNASPAVVSIVLTKDQPVFEQVLRDPFQDIFGRPSPFQVPQVEQRGTERVRVGEGSGFFVSADGLIVTNKHVVLEDDVEYTVFTKAGDSYAATVLARDPIQDLAIIRITPKAGEQFPFVRLGNSDALEIGQTVIAIGNALGEFTNSVSTGVISGLGRTITASDGGTFVETIEDVIQTDAAINKGNSGGPLLNLAGEVIGVNTATVLDAQSIGFAVPANIAKRDVEQVQSIGRIVYPLLGVRYVLVNKQVQEEHDLPVDYGAFILGSDTETAIVPGSAAATAGLQERDIILAMDGERITKDNSLAKQIRKRNPDDTAIVKILRGSQELEVQVVFGEWKE